MDNQEQDNTRSPSFNSSQLNNSTRFFFEDGRGSFLDLNVEPEMPESEDFEFQISFASLPDDYEFSIADELFKNGQIIPMENLEVVEVDGFSSLHSKTRVFQKENSFRDEAPVISMEEGLTVGADRRWSSKQKDQEVGVSRKSPKIMAVLLNNKITKFLIKFPSKNVRDTITFFRQSSRRSANHHPEENLQEATQQPNSPKPRRRLNLPFNRLPALKKKNNTNINTYSSKIDRGREVDGVTDKRRSSMLQRNMDTIRGALEALFMSLNSAARSKSRSCPAGSLHQKTPSQGSSSDYIGRGMTLERESSVNSAIAYCKLSASDN